MSDQAWAGYIRRSVKKEDDADISDDVQRVVITRRVPPGAEIEWFVDSGGHNSGFTDQRPGYQRMLAALREGRLAGITAYDDSRLNRNSENAMRLFRECASHAVLLRIDDSTMDVQQQYDDPSQKTMYGMRSLFSEQARAEMAKRNRMGARKEFDSGGVGGLIPFGYRGLLNEKSKPLREKSARVLEVVPEEAAVVVRLFEELAHSTLSEIAERFNVEGVLSPTSKGWSDGAVRAFWDRRWFYMGL
jgi:DNA invertase Pin-like site-specific DNA recombinase